MYNVSILNQTRPPNPLIQFLHQFDGINGAAPDATDETGKSLILSPTAELTTTDPISGTAMLTTNSVSGSGDVDRSDFAYDLSGTVEFCLETYIRIPLNANNWGFLGTQLGGFRISATMNTVLPDYRFRLSIQEGVGGLTAPAGLTVNSLNLRSSGSAIMHVALIRIANTIHLTVDGVVDVSIALVGPSLVALPGTPRFFVSAIKDGNNTIYIDSTRATVGSSVYGSVPFTPETAPLTLQLP